MSASEAGGAAPHALAMTIRSNNFAPKPMPQPITENQRNPLVNRSRDIAWLLSRCFALVGFGPSRPESVSESLLVSSDTAGKNEGMALTGDQKSRVFRYARRDQRASTLSSAANCKL